MATDEQQQAMTAARLAEINSLTADVVAGRIHVRFDEETGWLAIHDMRREVERLRTERAELAEKLDAEADYGASRIESLLKRCAEQRHRAHLAEQQRDAAMAVVRAVLATAESYGWRSEWMDKARALLASAGEAEAGEQTAQGEE